MNFLAHALLAGDEPADRIGGLLGDFVKGPLPAGLPPVLAAGVALHRAIDSYADTHPAFVRSRQRISAARRRVGGVLVDVFYDHLLARDWTQHGDGTLAQYTAQIYASLECFIDDLPTAAREVAALMQRHDWLGSYRDVGAVGCVIERMAIHRMRRANALPGGIDEFLADPAGFDADFRAFLPDALAFAQRWRAQRR